MHLKPFVPDYKKRRALITIQRRPCKFAVLYVYYMGNQRKAAIEAGYAVSSATPMANHLLKNPEILKLIDRTIREIEKELGIDLLWKFKKLKDIFEGNEKKAARTALAAMDMINKLDGDYAPERLQIEDKDKVLEAKEALAEAIKKNKMDY